MNKEIFSWQQGDYGNLYAALQSRILFIHGKDTLSPYNVFYSVRQQLDCSGKITFSVSMTNPNLVHPLLPFFQATCEWGRKSPLGKAIIANLVRDFTHSNTLAQLCENISESDKETSFLLTERENELFMRFQWAAEGCSPAFVFYGYPHFDSDSKK